MITWTKTETRTDEYACSLWVQDRSTGNRDATPADVIAAIEADEGLREAVSKYLVGVMDVRIDWRLTAEDNIKRATAAESDRDAWRARAERAEKELAAEFQLHKELGIDAARILKKERDTAIAQRREVERLCLESVRKAEKERDEARAEVERIREQADRPCTTCATLRTMLTDAKADYGRVAGKLHEIDAARETIARLEKELADARVSQPIAARADWYRAMSSQIMAQMTADAEELRARRALDEWERAQHVRSIACLPGSADCLPNRVRATLGNWCGVECIDAPTHVELARKLSLIH